MQSIVLFLYSIKLRIDSYKVPWNMRYTDSIMSQLHDGWKMKAMMNAK